MSIVYTVGPGLYVNLTNRCTADCDFCIRRGLDAVGDADTLWLEAEPTVRQVLDAITDDALDGASEVVFCGFGEPTIRLDELLDIAGALKARRPGIPIRVNTNGHANLIHGADVTPRLAGKVDALSISLNYPDAGAYAAHCRPEFGPGAYAAILEFTEMAKRHVPEITLTALDILTAADIAACREVAGRLGVGFRVRTAT